MTNGKLEIDSREILRALADLDYKKINKAYREALKKSVKPIYEQARMNLRKSGIKNVSRKYISKRNGREYPSMMSGIKTSTNAQQGDEWAKVHIMGEFRLKWFEMGTRLRKTSKGYNRGMIAPKWFFRQAVDSKSKECQEILDKNISESIMRAWNRR